jgi:hypothetical protein
MVCASHIIVHSTYFQSRRPSVKPDLVLLLTLWGHYQLNQQLGNPISILSQCVQPVRILLGWYGILAAGVTGNDSNTNGYHWRPLNLSIVATNKNMGWQTLPIKTALPAPWKHLYREYEWLVVDVYEKRSRLFFPPRMYGARAIGIPGVSIRSCYSSSYVTHNNTYYDRKQHDNKSNNERIYFKSYLFYRCGR